MYTFISALDPNVHIDLRYQLTTYRDTITTQFASYVSEVYGRIEAKQIGLNKIKQFLENKLDSDLDEANSLHDIFRLIRKRGKASFNFLNYRIYESLRDKFIPEERDEAFNYPDYLKDYANKHRLSEFLEINPGLKEIDVTTSNKTLHIKFDIQASDKLINVLELQQSLAPLLEVKPSALQILNIEQGCVIVTFLIPAHVAKVAFQHVREFTPEQLLKLSVKWIELGDGEKVTTEGIGEQYTAQADLGGFFYCSQSSEEPPPPPFGQENNRKWVWPANHNNKKNPPPPLRILELPLHS